MHKKEKEKSELAVATADVAIIDEDDEIRKLQCLVDKQAAMIRDLRSSLSGGSNGSSSNSASADGGRGTVAEGSSAPLRSVARLPTVLPSDSKQLPEPYLLPPPPPLRRPFEPDEYPEVFPALSVCSRKRATLLAGDEGDEEDDEDEYADYDELDELEVDDGGDGDHLRSFPRLEGRTDSMHFGDANFEVDSELADTSWKEFFKTCCCHTALEWAWIAVGVVFVLFFLYFFLFGLELLGSGAKVMTGCVAGELFGDDTNPIAGLMVGILSTVLLQSSSTTTSIVVSLVGSDVVSIDQGIYMVMGANIGTSVTSTIVAIGQMGDGDQLERAFAGATVHDMFNFMAVAILLPVEVVTHYLHRLTSALVRNASAVDVEKWEGPVRKYVHPLSKRIIIANKKLITAVAHKDRSCDNGGGFYPIVCEDGIESYSTCTSVGLIACDEKTKACPWFFQQTATASDDKVSGAVVFFLSIVVLFTCLMGLIVVMQKLLLGTSTRIVYKATDINGYIAILIGCGITVLVQSSSITTSSLTPLVGIGVIRLEQMYPLTLGANLGTTITAILASMVQTGTGALQVALAHLFFNVTGILIFYPIPFMRTIPIRLARQLGRATRIWRGFTLVYIGFMFILLPVVFLGLSELFETGSIGFVALGSFLTVILAIACVHVLVWCRCRGGSQRCADCMRRCELRRLARRDLPDDLDEIKEQVAILMDHTGLSVDGTETEMEKAGRSGRLSLPSERVEDGEILHLTN